MLFLKYKRNAIKLARNENMRLVFLFRCWKRKRNKSPPFLWWAEETKGKNPLDLTSDCFLFYISNRQPLCVTSMKQSLNIADWRAIVLGPKRKMNKKHYCNLFSFVFIAISILWSHKIIFSVWNFDQEHH